MSFHCEYSARGRSSLSTITNDLNRVLIRCDFVEERRFIPYLAEPDSQNAVNIPQLSLIFLEAMYKTLSVVYTCPTVPLTKTHYQLQQLLHIIKRSIL